MRILFVVHGYKPAYRVGGPILSVSALAQTLVAKGHHVTVFTTNSNLDEDLDVPSDCPVDVDGVEVWYFRRSDPIKRWLPFFPYLSQSMGFLYTPRMTGELDRLMPDIDLVHTHMPFVYPTYAASKAVQRWHKPLFYHQRGVFDPDRLKFRPLKKRLYIWAVERNIMRKATTLIALTETERQSYKALGLHTPCRVIPNGIDVAAYRQEPSLETDAQWNIPPGAPVILFLGRLHPTKGADKLLEAFVRVRDRCPTAVLFIAGPDEWGLERKYQEMIRTAKLAGRVFFPGMMLGEAKLDLLARADLFCLPSMGEGFSIAVLEALASRTAVLLSPGCHFPEVEKAGAGRVVPLETEAIANGLADLLSDRDRLRKMGEAGLDLVRCHYTWDHITDQLIDAYEEGIVRTRRNLVSPGSTFPK
jgi:glycosyltransferase involved in cell wall biosynthesis